MATKLDRKQLPSGHSASDFKYMGRPAKDQGDFGPDVGLADMACVNQFGEANNAKYYSCGVVQSTKTNSWFVYLEWGRMKSAHSWNGSFGGGDYQFVECSGETDARDFFCKQASSKNIKRMVQRSIGGKTVWTSKDGEDGYIVQRLATREKGLPDAYRIKDDSGVVKAAASVAPSKPSTPKPAVPSRSYQPQVLSLAQALVGGTQTYTRALSAAAGVTPTMDTIKEVREDLIPLALQRIKVVGADVTRQVRDKDLVAISKMVAALVPRPIPRQGQSAEEAILSGNNIMTLEQDLDAFEASLRNEDFTEHAPVTTVDPDRLLNARLTWLNPAAEGKWVCDTLQRMSNNRHSYLSGSIRILNLFRVERSDRDSQFLNNVEIVAGRRRGQFSLRANLQPPTRGDLEGKEATLYRDANVILTQHGTRSVNVAPITQTHFRLPKQLPGALICGANFGHGIYHAVDFRKAVGYTSYDRAAWSSGGGGVKGRGAFMFLNDMLMGQTYRAPSTGSWDQPPNGCDSVFGVGGDRGHRLENDELVVFNPHFTRIRYLVEFTF